MTIEQDAWIVDAWAYSGETQKAVALKHGLHPAEVSIIVRRFLQSQGRITDGVYNEARRSEAIWAVAWYLSEGGELTPPTTRIRYDAAHRAYEAARREHAVRMRDMGETFAAVGARLGITAGRVRQIYMKEERNARMAAFRRNRNIS